MGARVRCEGLTGAAELNGCLGRVVSHDGARAKVRMDAAGARVVGVKPQNLVVVVGGGDWATQTDDPEQMARALGWEVVQRKAAEGNKEAQFSVGVTLLNAADRAEVADVGLALCTHTFAFAVAQKSHDRRDAFDGHLVTKLKRLRVPTLGGEGGCAAREGGEARACARYVSCGRQGPTLVHSLAQPTEPFLTQNTPYTPPELPLNHPSMHPESNRKRLR